MTDPVGKRGTSFAVFTPVMVALLVGLGVWQLQRRVEQQALIAALNERLAAVPVPLPDPTQWAALTSEKDEFRRVSFTATYESRLDATVHSSDTSMRDDISGPGDWAFIPARLPNGDTVAVDVGFVPNTTQDRNQQDRVVAQLITNKPVNLTGYLRFPVATGLFTPNVEHDKQLWFTRDHRAGARVGSGCAVLHRSGGASAAERHPETRAASAARARQPHAICHHLPFAGRLAADRICCPAARPNAYHFLKSLSGLLQRKSMSPGISAIRVRADSPTGWPQRFEGKQNFRIDGRPIAQWSRLKAEHSDDLSPDSR